MYINTNNMQITRLTSGYWFGYDLNSKPKKSLTTSIPIDFTLIVETTIVVWR